METKIHSPLGICVYISKGNKVWNQKLPRVCKTTGLGLFSPWKSFTFQRISTWKPSYSCLSYHLLSLGKLSFLVSLSTRQGRHMYKLPNVSSFEFLSCIVKIAFALVVCPLASGESQRAGAEADW